VIVPVYRQWDLIADLLAGLARQTLPGTMFETILVDNGSAGEAPAMSPRAHVRLLHCATPGAYAARNAGAAAARSGLLVFTDADCRPEPAWLEALVRAAARRPDTLLAGPVRMTAREPARPNRYENYDRFRGIPQARYVANGYAATANLSVPRPIFLELGGFDDRRFSGGDADFCRRAGRAGHGIALVEDAVVFHPCRRTWDELAIKARRVKGGQLTQGGVRSRAIWFLRTLTPPARALARFWRTDAPQAERRAAIAVLFRLWGVELAETVRLLAGGTPERR
jgi:GT2 family glycosyltransferase